MKLVTVREFARLTTTAVSPTLDQATVTESAFKHLCDLSAAANKGGVTLIQIEDRLSLRLDNFVGVIETPCGTILEILPKHVDHQDDAVWARGILKKMLLTALDLPQRAVGEASIDLFKSPLYEWVIHCFLQSLDHLVKRGLRFDYMRVNEEYRSIRGQLDFPRQMRQQPGRQHFFQIRHDVFTPDRPENRLLKSALDKVCKCTQEPENWRLAHELAIMLAEIPPSTDRTSDFRKWGRDRLMTHYQPAKPWCELVLGEHMPLALRGGSNGLSLLFPMEKLFERFVADSLEGSLLNDATLYKQVSGRSLCEHKGAAFFQLHPDLMISQCNTSWILDTKWKLLEDKQPGYKASEGYGNYGLSQSDFYQLFAYGHKYLNGSGDLVLIYPSRADFTKALPVFNFSDQLRLWVVPFDLDRGVLMSFDCVIPLVSGDVLMNAI